MSTPNIDRSNSPLASVEIDRINTESKRGDLNLLNGDRKAIVIEIASQPNNAPGANAKTPLMQSPKTRTQKVVAAVMNNKGKIFGAAVALTGIGLAVAHFGFGAFNTVNTISNPGNDSSSSSTAQQFIDTVMNTASSVASSLSSAMNSAGSSTASSTGSTGASTLSSIFSSSTGCFQKGCH